MQALAWLAPVRVEVKHPCYGPARTGKVIASSLMTKLRIVSLILECGHQVIDFFLGVGFLPRCFLSLCRFLPPRTSWKKYIVHLSNLFERLSHCEVSGPRLPLVLRAGAPAKNRRLLSTSNRKCPHVLQLLLAVRSKMLYHPYHLP